MKNIFLILLSLAALSSPLLAQKGDFVITKIAPAVIHTPEFQFTGDPRRSPLNEKWLEVETEFTAKPDFTDELTFRYYVLIAGKLLTGEVTHINIAKGRELHSVMYLSPRTLDQLTGGKQLTANSIENVAVQLLSKGQLMDELSFKQDKPEWWQSMQQVTGLLLNKNETPFAPLYWDRYEQIKPAAH